MKFAELVGDLPYEDVPRGLAITVLDKAFWHDHR
jgi:hypothetical protein